MYDQVICASALAIAGTGLKDGQRVRVFGMRQFSEGDLYSTVLHELYSKKSQRSQMHQIIYLGFRSVKK